MTKLVVPLVLCLCNAVFAVPLQDHKIDSSALIRLAQSLGIPADADIVAEAQKRWLRKAGQERWELTELALEQRRIVLKWAQEQGLFSHWTPSLTKYDKALILGATTPRMEMRLNYLKQLWNQGVRFNEIVWLTGDRPLNSHADRLTERCDTESQAARVLWQEADLPDAMRNLPVVFVAVPMKGEGLFRQRPSTEDTVIAWLEQANSCKALFVSNQPLCGYQFAVVKAHLPNKFQFDLVGPGFDLSNPPFPAIAALTLDSLARWLYIEKTTAT